MSVIDLLFTIIIIFQALVLRRFFFKYKSEKRKIIILAHDLQTPIHVLNNSLELFKSRTTVKIDQHALESYKKSVVSLLELNLNYVDWLINEKNNTNLKEDINLVLSEIKSEIESTLFFFSVKLQIELTFSHTLRIKNKMYVKTFLRNCITNSIKHSNAKNVKIVVSFSNPVVTIKIFDDGLILDDFKKQYIYNSVVGRMPNSNYKSYGLYLMRECAIKIKANFKILESGNNSYINVYQIDFSL